MEEPKTPAPSATPPTGTETPPATPPAATPPAGEPGATPPADGDANSEAFRKMQSEKDRAQHRIGVLESVLEPIVIEREVDKFLSGNKDKFPDLTREDLMHVQSLEESDLTKEATRLQTRLQAHAQKTIIDIENPKAPTMTEEQKKAEMEKLKTSKAPGRFQAWLRLKSA